jgi:putative lipoic acid-binding regulatory protein
MSTDEPKLEELLEYPCSFTFRVVASASQGLEQRCRDLVEGELGRPAVQCEHQPSKKGSYASVRVTAVVLSADEIRAAYQALKGGVQGIKMLL